MLPAEYETMGAASGGRGGVHCQRRLCSGRCRWVARRTLPKSARRRTLPAERATTAAGGGRGGCIAAWEVGHVEDEHEGSAENFSG